MSEFGCEKNEILKLIQKLFEPIVLISAEFCKAVIVDEPSH